jgi:gas vesicle protein
MRKFGSFVLGAFIGGIVGSLLAMLFAPVSGGMLQERLRHFTTNIRDEVKTAAEQRSIELRQQLAAMQKKE